MLFEGFWDDGKWRELLKKRSQGGGNKMLHSRTCEQSESHLAQNANSVVFSVLTNHQRPNMNYTPVI